MSGLAVGLTCLLAFVAIGAAAVAANADAAMAAINFEQPQSDGALSIASDNALEMGYELTELGRTRRDGSGAGSPGAGSDDGYGDFEMDGRFHLSLTFALVLFLRGLITSDSTPHTRHAMCLDLMPGMIDADWCVRSNGVVDSCLQGR